MAEAAPAGGGLPATARMPDPARRRPRVRFPSAVFFPVLLIDAWIVMDWLGGTRTLGSALGLHAAAGVGLVLAQALARRSFGARDLVLVVILLLLGPLSGMLVLLRGASAVWTRRDAEEPAKAGSTPGRGSAGAIFAAIRQGRRPAMPPQRIGSLAAMIESSDRDAQNAAIAAISQHYCPDMLPALTAALASEVPAVRVQAAAVFAKYRTEYGAKAAGLLAAGGDVAATDAGERAAQCRKVAASGFVDGTSAAALAALAGALEATGEAARRPSALREIQSPKRRRRTAKARHVVERAPRAATRPLQGAAS